MTEQDLRAELDALRREIADLRRAAEPPPPDSAATTCCGEGLDHVVSLLHAAVERVRETAAAHPVPAVLASLLVGMLIGRRAGR